MIHFLDESVNNHNIKVFTDERHYSIELETSESIVAMKFLDLVGKEERERDLPCALKCYTKNKSVGYCDNNKISTAIFKSSIFSPQEKQWLFPETLNMIFKFTVFATIKSVVVPGDTEHDFQVQRLRHNKSSGCPRRH